MKFKKYIPITILICFLSCQFIHNPFKDSGSFLVDTVYDTKITQTTITTTSTITPTSSSTIAPPTTTTTTIQPELYCNENTISFYTKLKGEYLTSSFEISNLGSGSIEYEVTSDSQSVSLNKVDGVIDTNVETIDLTIDTTNLELGNNAIVVTITAVNPPDVINPIRNITINFNLETNSKSGKTFCKLSGSGDTQKISWNGLPADTTTDIKVYYYTNDYSNNDLNLDFNDKYNLLIPKSIDLITFIKDPVLPYKKDSYYIKLNSGDGDREIYIWKIEWDGGDFFADENSGLFDGAELVTP